MSDLKIDQERRRARDLISGWPLVVIAIGLLAPFVWCVALLYGAYRLLFWLLAS